jgi:hypothetical protein
MTKVVKANGEPLIDKEMGVKAPISPLDQIRRLYAADATGTTSALIEALTGLIGRDLLLKEQKMALLKAVVASL